MKYDKVIRVCKYLSNVKPGSVVLTSQYDELNEPYLVTDRKMGYFVTVVCISNGALLELSEQREVEIIEDAS